MLLIDGNRYCFKDDIIRAGASGARDAAHRLMAEAREHAESQHMNDLPESISTVIHIFLDVGRLADDLVAAGMLSGKDQLLDFLHSFSQAGPLIAVTDCGPGREAVDAKLKGRCSMVETVQPQEVTELTSDRVLRVIHRKLPLPPRLPCPWAGV